MRFYRDVTSLFSLHDNHRVFNTLRPRPNGRHFPDDIFKWIFLNENECISIKISLKLVPRGPISNIPALVQIMAWRRSGDKPLSEPMVVSLLTHKCVTRPQWVNMTLGAGVTNEIALKDRVDKIHFLTKWSFKTVIWTQKSAANVLPRLPKSFV